MQRSSFSLLQKIKFIFYKYIYNYNNDSLINNRFSLIEFENLLYRHNMYKKLYKSTKDEKYLIAEYFFLFNRLKSEKNIYYY